MYIYISDKWVIHKINVYIHIRYVYIYLNIVLQTYRYICPNFQTLNSTLYFLNHPRTAAVDPTSFLYAGNTRN